MAPRPRRPGLRASKIRPPPPRTVSSRAETDTRQSSAVRRERRQPSRDAPRGTWVTSAQASRYSRPMARAAQGYRLDADGGERLRFSEAEVLIRASAETTGGAFSITEEIDPLDTPLHVHEREHELFYVLEGEHVF